jgi:hypothetical protein
MAGKQCDDFIINRTIFFPPLSMTMDAVHKQMSRLEGFMAPLFAKTPHLPENARKTLVTVVPWLALIFGILGILSIFSAVAALQYLMAFPMGSMMGGSWYPAMIVSLLCGLIGAILDLLAFKPLKGHHKKGWNLLFLAATLSSISVIVNFVFGFGGILALLGVLIGYWLLFEIRGHYR